MPVKSSTSSVFRWPDKSQVHAAVCAWAERTAASHPDVRGVAYIGSYARGDWGVGSDVDLVLIVGSADASPFERAASFPTDDLPVPADVLVFTESEWREMAESGVRFYQEAVKHGVWVYSEAD